MSNLVLAATSLLLAALGIPALSAQTSASSQSASISGLFGAAYVPGKGADPPAIAKGIVADWNAKVQENQHADWTGSTVIECDVKRDGALGKVKVVRTSGSKALDELATSAAKSASPFRKLPPDFKGTKFRLFFYYNMPSTADRPSCTGMHLPSYPHVGGSVRAPKAIYMPDPEYSEEARRAHYQGTVILNLTVTADGAPTEICLDRMAGLGLDEQAVTAVRRWKFEPATKDGQPVALRISAETQFRLY